MAKAPAGKSLLIAYAIFEGGGAKGVSHVGALKALEDENIQLVGVAGTSAGAIIATLVAVGYTADELIDPELAETGWNSSDKWNIFLRHGLSPVKLIGESQWDEFERIGRQLADRPGLFAAGLYARHKIGLAPAWLRSALGAYGILDTSAAHAFLNARLLDKVEQRTTVENGIVRFRHLSPTIKGNLPLKLVVTDLSKRSLVLVDSSEPQFDDLVVADVVVASMSIPLIFRPRSIGGLGGLFVDGGLVGNLPVWAFLEDRVALQRKLGLGTPIPTIAFLSDGSSAAEAIGSLKDFAKSVARTGVFGSQRKAIELVPGVIAVDLRSSLDTTEFDPSRKAAMAAYSLGRDRAVATLDERLRSLPDESVGVLKATLSTVRRAIVARTPALRAEVKSCRLALLYPVGRISVRTVAAVNREGDGDEDMVYDIESPAAPAALRLKRVHHFSFARCSAKSLVMTPVEFARQRKGLKSLVAIPIFSSLAVWNMPETDRPRPSGVLVLDADFDLKAVITAGGIEDDLITQSVLLHPLLEKLRTVNGERQEGASHA